MNDTAQVPQLIVIVGPIASGKTTIACKLGDRIRAADRAVAVLDLDDVVDTIGGFADLSPQKFREAMFVHGLLVGAWLRRRFDVIAHGPFFEPGGDEVLLHAVPAGVTPRCVQLMASYETALARTAPDPDRALSKNPTRLRLAYDRAESLLPTMPPSEWSFDTTTQSSREIVDSLATALPMVRRIPGHVEGGLPTVPFGELVPAEGSRRLGRTSSLRRCASRDRGSVQRRWRTNRGLTRRTGGS